MQVGIMSDACGNNSFSSAASSISMSPLSRNNGAIRCLHRHFQSAASTPLDGAQDREVITVTPNFCDPAALDLPLQAAAA
jgi:hypothetical protein